MGLRKRGVNTCRGTEASFDEIYLPLTDKVYTIVTHSRLSALLLSVLLCVSLVAGAAAPVAADHGAHADNHEDERDDPEMNYVGWYDGYWHDDSIDIDQSDGLNDTELDRYKARSMARVEHIRGLAFKEDVPVEVISRSEYREENPFEADLESEHADWNNQIWEALFIVGQDTEADAAIQNVMGGATQGYYSPANDKIVIVAPDGEPPRIDESTLIHELGHALQDQYYDLSDPKYSGDVQDRQLSTNGLIEGEAMYYEHKYREMCTAGEWACEDYEGTTDAADANLGIQLIVYQPYSDGAEYINQLHQDGGWDAVDEAWENPPTSTREIIRPGEESAEPLELEDTSYGGWEQFSDDVGNNGTDSLGEASMYVMFWYQGYQYGTEAISQHHLSTADGEYAVYNYNHSLTNGLEGDVIAPYKNGDKRGYVWKTQWEDQESAERFYRNYKEVLRGHGAEDHGSGWVIPDGDYAAAFSIAVEDDTVYIAKAPSLDAANGLQPVDEDQSTEAGGESSETSTPNSSENSSSPFGEYPALYYVLPPVIAFIALVFLFFNRIL